MNNAEIVLDGNSLTIEQVISLTNSILGFLFFFESSICFSISFISLTFILLGFFLVYLILLRI